MQRSSALGMLPLVLRLIVPLERTARIRSIAAAMAIERSSGSPFAALAERDDAVVDALEMMDCDARELVRLGLVGDARLR